MSARLPRFLVVFAAAALLASALDAAPRRRAAASPNFPDAAVAAIGAGEISLGVPGITIAVAEGNRLSFVRSYGVMDLDTMRAARLDSVFQIASLTKQMTAAAVMRLAEAGKLKVTDQLESYIPEFAGSGIHLDHLLNQTSGLPEYTSMFDPYAPVTPDALISRIAIRPRDFTPGSRFAYSNTNYFILGRVIEKVDGRSYAAFVQQELFAPAGLVSTGLCGSRSDLAVPAGYGVITSENRIPLQPVEMSVAWSAGGVCSTAMDLARWNRALVSGVVVSRASYEAMTKAVTLTNGGISRYGFGLVSDTDRGNPVVWHDGLIDGFQSFLAYYPERDLTIAVLANGIGPDLVWLPANEAGMAIARTLVPSK